MNHILILTKGIIWDKSGPSATKLDYLRQYFSGDIVHSVEKKYLISDEWSGFKLCGCYTPLWVFNKLGPLYSIYFFIHVLIRFFYRHYFVKQYDCIIARDPIIVGPLALILGKICGIPYIVEMNGNYANEIVWNEGRPSLGSKCKFLFVMRLIPFILNRAGGIRILYPQQLAPYAPRFKLRKQRIACFHEFTQIENTIATGRDEKYLLLLGAPAYIKGADVLVSAFVKISNKFPDYRLKIVGWYPPADQAALKALANNNRVEILPPVPPNAAQDLIDRCTFFILPSRTEGMGRVLLEAMAHGKAVIGSNIEGIPHYVQDKINGLLFENENADRLAEAMTLLLSDSAARSALADNGKKIVFERYSEEAYAIHFDKLVTDVNSAPKEFNR